MSIEQTGVITSIAIKGEPAMQNQQKPRATDVKTERKALTGVIKLLAQNSVILSGHACQDSGVLANSARARCRLMVNQLSMQLPSKLGNGNRGGRRLRLHAVASLFITLTRENKREQKPTKTRTVRTKAP